jgi:hypothetical protein
MPDRMTEWLAVKTDALQLGQTPCRNSRGAPSRVAPWKDRADFAAGTSIRPFHWVCRWFCCRNCGCVVETVAGGFLKVQQANPASC